MKTRFLVIITVFLVLLPWIRGIYFGINNEVLVDWITTSALVVMTITLTFSLISWGLFSWASKNISYSGILLAIISGASLVIPFLQVLGPMAGVILGVVAGFVAFMLQKKMQNPAKNHPLLIAAMILVASYCVLFVVVLATQSSVLWDSDNGIGEWTGTAESMDTLSFDRIFFQNTGVVFLPVIITSLIMTGLIIRK